ncbi:hypothetical protein GGR56DRAFT_691998 [Xylariaceae sp. FL0804]|nr:hypothetical protein GGR56DRAFT_691998 [Xylariaceae sp. FL0804]
MPSSGGAGVDIELAAIMQQPPMTATSVTSPTGSTFGGAGFPAVAGAAKEHDFNMTPQTASDIAALAHLTGLSEDETFEWMTSDQVVRPFDDWVRDAVMVRQAQQQFSDEPSSPTAAVAAAGFGGAGAGMPLASGMDLARVQNDLVLFFKREVRRDADIPVPTLSQLSAVRGTPLSGQQQQKQQQLLALEAETDWLRAYAAVSLEDLAKRFVLALMRRNLKPGGAFADHKRDERGYAELIIIAVRVLAHLVGVPS